MLFINRQEMRWPPSAARSQPSPPKGVKVHYLGDAVPSISHAKCVGFWTGIRNSHLANKVENYADVAYNLAVCQHGYVLEGRGAGRQTGANGNQTLNAAHYAVCVLIGGNTEPSPEAVGALREAIQYLRSRGAGNEIKGHRDGFPTDCPGRPLYDLVKSGALDPNNKEDDMPAPKDLWDYVITLPDGRKQPVRDIVGYSDWRHDILAKRLTALEGQLAEVLKLLKQKP